MRIAKGHQWLREFGPGGPKVHQAGMSAEVQPQRLPTKNVFLGTSKTRTKIPLKSKRRRERN